VYKYEACAAALARSESYMQGFNSKPEGKRPLGRSRRMWNDSIKMCVKYGGRVWAGVAWLKLGTGGGLL
jgi:hypothetical protein